ncbi:hypothetical protein NPIL_441681 [Nephila pilipes]|uniref:Uncharacterized protein n=1 Tax=Nephila pilipes TaxID=299642 RepID=A0A8X6T8E9_NEPPI|nr:hypothetical protein NPIL_441681 [Nephila pilipes]
MPPAIVKFPSIPFQRYPQGCNRSCSSSGRSNKTVTIGTRKHYTAVIPQKQEGASPQEQAIVKIDQPPTHFYYRFNFLLGRSSTRLQSASTDASWKLKVGQWC